MFQRLTTWLALAAAFAGAAASSELEEYIALGLHLDVLQFGVFDEDDVRAAVGVGGVAGYIDAVVSSHRDPDSDVAAVGRPVIAFNPQLIAVGVGHRCSRRPHV